jgi:hypothetical protein
MAVVTQFPSTLNIKFPLEYDHFLANIKVSQPGAMNREQRLCISGIGCLVDAYDVPRFSARFGRAECPL